MSDDKTREEFEAWAGHAYSFERQDVIGGYTSVVTQCAFDSWKHQAARIAELEAQVMALRDDAERWREVLTNDGFVVCTSEVDEIFKSKLEHVIDAARAAKG